MRVLKGTVVMAVLLLPSAVAAAAPQAALESFLIEGKLAEAREAMERRVERDGDSVALYAVGIVDTLLAVEHLAQNLHRYGLRPTSRQVPFVRLPVPENPDPEPLTYEKWRAVLQAFIDDLERAEDSLARLDDEDVKLTLPVGLIRLDLNGDGEASETETFWKVFTAVAWRAAKLSPDEQRFDIGFDQADAHWLIGYTHLLRAMAEAWLAYDTREFFDQTASVFFAGAPKGIAQAVFLKGPKFAPEGLADLVAVIHLMHFDLVEPKRMRASRKHLFAMIAASREVWNHATEETDDDREWIPNAQQTSLTPLTVNQARIDAWARFLDEAEAVLRGKMLVPHWRVTGDQGINLKRVFTEPRPFDLVMWIHGAAAVPFLEKGELVTRETARTLSRTFQGRFVVFAIWFQ